MSEQSNLSVDSFNVPHEGSLVPDAPFQRHLHREGEPPFPIFFSPEQVIKYGRKYSEDPHNSWIDWSMKQPDSGLLAAEFCLFESWAAGNGSVDDKETKLVQTFQGQIVNALRQAGHSEIVRKYWAHLSTSSK